MIPVVDIGESNDHNKLALAVTDPVQSDGLNMFISDALLPHVGGSCVTASRPTVQLWKHYLCQAQATGMNRFVRSIQLISHTERG
jgi:hypothetical protein